jgi:two-component system cell cycle sensor histidine kinase/response regulator CckA
MSVRGPGGQDVAALLARIAELEARENELQQELKAQRELAFMLRTIIDLLPHRIFWKDREYRFLGCNKALGQDAQLERPEDIVGKSDAELPWRHLAPIYRADDIAVVVEGRSKLNYEEPLELPNGQRLWLRTSKLPLRDEAGKIIGLVGYFEDLTSQRNVLLGLRESEARYRNLVEQALDGIFIANKIGRWVNVNAAGARLLGYMKEEIIGKRIEDLVDPQDLAETPLRARELSGGERLLSYRRLRHKDGSSIPAEISSVRLPDGTLEAIVRDMRPRTHAEEQRRKLEEQLRHAQKMESIGRLAGGIAHDFNNLLLIILANAYLLKRKQGGQTGREIDGIVEASERGSRLTRQLLAFSSKRVLRPVVLDLNEVVRGMAGLLERLLGEQFELKFELTDANCAILADSNQLEQVLMNLSVNARDAMTPGGQLSVSTSLEETPYAHGLVREVVLRVKDTGHGMDAVTLAHMFEPFFTTKPLGEGTGLGLSMVYGIVTQSGGTIDVKSAQGAGTTFEIRLPAAGEQVRPRSDRPSAPLPAASARRSSPGFGGATILLVEDDSAVRDTLERTLLDAGYHVLVARGGEEALRIADADMQGFDLLVSDVVMSSLSGPLLAQRLLAQRANLPVLLMSGYSDRLFSDGGLDERLHFIEKPFTPASFLARIADLLALLG